MTTQTSADARRVPRRRAKTRSEEAATTVRGRRTRDALIQAARLEFEEVGFRDARVVDITRRAQTSYGTFYTYFDDKDDVLKGVIRTFTGEMFAASEVGSRLVVGPIAKVEIANRGYLRAYARNARIMRVVEEVAPYDDYSRDLLADIRARFVKRNEASIRRLQELGLADQHVDARIAASALGGMVEQYARTVFLMGEPYDEDTAVEVLTRLWVQALGMDRATAAAKS